MDNSSDIPSDIAPDNPTAQSPPSVLSRLPWLLALEALLLVVLVYPMQFSDRWLERLGKPWDGEAALTPLKRLWYWLCREQFEPILSAYHDVLLLKGVVASACALGLFSVLLASSSLHPIGQSLRPWGRDRPARDFDVGRRWAYGSWLLLMAWLAGSAFWSPTRALSLEGLYWLIALGGFAYVLLRRGLSPGEIRQASLLMILLGAVVSLISIAEYIGQPAGRIFDFLPWIDDPRNRYGSLIGHNTAVGSFMLMTAFPAVAFAVDGRTLAHRFAALLYLVLALVTILIVQSRAIWILTPVLGSVFLYVTTRQRGAPRMKRVTIALLSIFALVMLSQAVRVSWNPLYVEESSISRRFADLTPARLKEESRLRLLICSMPLVREQPIIGSGLYAFQYVYPKAQADYFALHPDSPLGRTKRRSNMAHNEYLQVLVEQGAIGLFLLGLAWLEPIVRGGRIGRKLRGPDRLLHTAMGFSALGVALHALSDFPFHVPQLAIPWFFCVAAYGSFREPDPSSGSVAESEGPGRRARTRAPSVRAIQGRGGRGTLRPGYVACLMLASAFVFGLPLAIYPFAGFLQADAHHQTAAALMNLLREKDQAFPPSEKRRFLRMASDRLNETLRKHPTNDRARLLLGETHLFEGIYHIREAASRGASASTDGPNPAAVLALEKAVAELEGSLTSLRYHQSYYLLGLAYRTLALHVRDEPRHGRYLEACRDSFESAVYFGPNYTPALFELSELLEEMEQPLDDYYRNRITQLRRAIRESAYFDFDRYFVFPTNRLLADQNYWQAAREVDEKLLAVAPMDPDYLRLGIEAHMQAGNHRRVLELVERTRRHPDHYAIFYTSMGGAYAAIIQKDWALLLEELTHYGILGLRSRAELAAFETHARNQLRLGDIRSQFPPPAGTAPEEWEWVLAEENAFFQYRLLGDAESGRRAFEHRLGLAAPAPSIEFWIEYAYLALAERDEPLVRECLGEIRTRRADHPVLRTLANALREFGQAAPR